MLDHGDTFTHEGLTFSFEMKHDWDHGAPWIEEAGHGEVSDWTRRDKLPGEMILCEDRGARRFYDFAGAVKTAKRDGWNAKPYDIPGETKGQRAHKAAMADFKRLQDWLYDRWHYVGVIVTCEDLPGRPSESLWGIESDADEYLDEVARELASELIAEAVAEVARAVA